MSTTEQRMKEANIFWEHARERVLSIAAANNINVPPDGNGLYLDELLFSVFDYGDCDPSDDEILDELHETYG